MNFSEFIDVIYIKGYFSSQADFLKELLNNSVQNPEKISLADSTLKGYFSGNSITELADMLDEAVLDTDSLCNHINGLYSAKHKNTKTYDEKYGEKLYKDILFERSTKAFGDIIKVEDMARFLSDQFKKIIDETINQSTTKAPIQTSNSSRLSYIIEADEKQEIKNVCSLIGRSLNEIKRIATRICDKKQELAKLSDTESNNLYKQYLEHNIKSAEEELSKEYNGLEPHCGNAMSIIEPKKHLLKSLNDIYELSSEIINRKRKIIDNIVSEYSKLYSLICKYQTAYKNLLREIDKV